MRRVRQKPGRLPLFDLQSLLTAVFCPSAHADAIFGKVCSPKDMCTNILTIKRKSLGRFIDYSFTNGSFILYWVLFDEGE